MHYFPYHKPCRCRDAEDAVKGRDGYMFDNNPIRVELSRGGMGGGRRYVVCPDFHITTYYCAL